MKVPRYRPEAGILPRRLLLDGAVIIALLIAGGLCGAAARLWIGGLNAQHVQLERCIRTSRQSHSSEKGQSVLTHLDADVPACMSAAGYEAALDDQRCSPAFWQGDVFCYAPKSSFRKLIYRFEAASAEKRINEESGKGSSRRES
jgi:hypothetical protein